MFMFGFWYHGRVSLSRAGIFKNIRELIEDPDLLKSFTKAEWFPESLLEPVLGFNASSVNSAKDSFLERGTKHLDICLMFFNPVNF